MQQREQIFRTIQAKTNVPVLILGGGINGLGLFRELALQGVDCLLVDKADFSAGATSKSSRMIHGGLRYLENREFKLVKEALLERNRLLENAGHYVAPLRTTIPLPSRLGGLLRSMLIFAGIKVRPGERGAVPVKFGLMFYDFITRKNRKTPTHFLTSKTEALSKMPGLRRNIVGTATYWDAWITQAERLCIELVRDAQEAHSGCHALNYVAFEGMKDGAVVLRDQVSGETATVKPKILINATGAWVDRTNATLGLKTRFMGGTKGSHLVVDCPALHKALDGQMVYYQYHDGRVCIVFPFLDKVIMGSTDIRVDDPETATCDEDEMAYMFTTLREVFPEIEIKREHIVFVYCGVRPLPSSDGVTANISRGHSVRVVPADGDRPFPLYALVGGKWTTFRAFAEEVADRVLAEIGATRRSRSVEAPIGGGKGFPRKDDEKRAWVERVAKSSGLSAERLEVLLSRYGTDAERYADKDETPLTSLPDYSVEEIRRIVKDEYVEHLSDVVCRRTLIAITGRASKDALTELADIAGEQLGWDADCREGEVRETLDLVRVPGAPQTA